MKASKLSKLMSSCRIIALDFVGGDAHYIAAKIAISRQSGIGFHIGGEMPMLKGHHISSRGKRRRLLGSAVRLPPHSGLIMPALYRLVVKISVVVHAA